MNARDLLRDLLGVVLLGITVFMLASVLSFDVADLAYRVAPSNESPANWGGSLGASLAAFLLEWVGTLGALGTGLLVGSLGWSCVRPKKSDDLDTRVEPLRRIVGGLVVVLTLSVLERVVVATPWAGLVDSGLHAGGTWGLFLEATLSRLLGGAGTVIALIVIGAVGLVLFANRPVHELLSRSMKQAHEAANRARVHVAAAEDALARTATATPALAIATAGTESLARIHSSTDPLADEASEDDSDADEAPSAEPSPRGTVRLPGAELLSPALAAADRPAQDPRAKLIEETLKEFKLPAVVASIEYGPAVTLFALELGRGIKVQRLTGLLDNLAIALRVPGIRLQAPIPGTCWVGLEVPNEHQEVVAFRGLFEHPGWRDKKPAIPLFLGKDSSGRPLIADLAKMPHLLIAGATGSGKSVCINTIILSILMCRTSREVQLILIDPKQVELSQFKNVPHLLHPVVTDMRQAGAVLAWACKKMDERYTCLARAGVRHLREYNALGKDELMSRLEMTEQEMVRKRIPWKLPYIVLVVDELNDLMMVAQKEIEGSITRLAQKSRAVGIHVILATQRPSVDVITGVIKSNLPARISFRVTSKVDSRTILDMSGAEKLLGMGDMLFMPPGRNQPIRAQGAFVTDKEVDAVVKAVSKGAGPEFSSDLAEAASAVGGEGAAPGADTGDRDDKDRADPTYRQAIRVVLTTGRGSVSLIQRKMQVGYSRAARLLDLMATDGIVGPSKGSKARDLQITLEDWESSQED